MEDELVFIEKIRAELEGRIEIYRNAGCKVDDLVEEFKKLKIYLDVVHSFPKASSPETVSSSEQAKLDAKKDQEQRAEQHIADLTKEDAPAETISIADQAKIEAKKLQEERAKKAVGALTSKGGRLRRKRGRTIKKK